MSTAPLRDHHGAVTGILAVIADVTERKRMLDQFNQAERLAAMARLAGGVAHDFNNLLTVILGSSEILERQLPGHAGCPARGGRHPTRRRAGRRAHQRAAGHRPPRGDPALGGRAADGRDVHGADARAGGWRRASTSLSPADEAHGRVLVDPAEIERVVLNLVINARDAMPDGGRIEVRTRPPASLDPAADVRRSSPCRCPTTAAAWTRTPPQHCFEPFFTTKGRAHGTGLGLAAVHAVVTQAGGHLTLDTAPGEGTIFTLWFPAVERDRP